MARLPKLQKVTEGAWPVPPRKGLLWDPALPLGPGRDLAIPGPGRGSGPGFCPYLIQLDDVRVIQKLHDLNLTVDFLQVTGIQARLVDDLYGDLEVGSARGKEEKRRWVSAELHGRRSLPEASAHPVPSVSLWGNMIDF